MNIKITPSPLNGSIHAIPSKSAAHRVFICAALSDKKCSISLPKSCDDIDMTLKCLEALGANMERTTNGVAVTPVWSNLKQKTVLDCGESGSTLRFLLPVAAALGVNTVFVGKGRLPERPLSPLKEQLMSHGIKVKDNGIIEISGKLQPGEFTLSGDVSSQFITGLLFALPLLDGDSTINLTSPLQSKGYVDMTIDALRQFGVTIYEGENFFSVKGNQQFISPASLNVEGDWSNAAFWLVAGVLNGDIEITGMDMNSKQGDMAIVDILKRMGAQIDIKGISIRCTKSHLKATDIDASNIPDLVPVLAVAASLAEGETRIYNAERLRLKESDRLKTTSEAILSLGGQIHETDDGLVIFGKPSLDSGQCDSFNDHRIAMSLAVASVSCTAPVIIERAQAVQKSYPDFFEDMKLLGAKIEEIL